MTSKIGDEEANGSVKRVELPASASLAQRRAFDATRVFNDSTGEMEHKQTLMTREQHMNVDDKAAPGRLRYRHGSRMAIISEDDESETGFWHGAVYQYHRTANVGRELKTRAGPRCCSRARSRWALRASRRSARESGRRALRIHA